jgi:hypothetical protein
MLEIIISLLMAIGININENPIEVMDERTGIVYGVGSNSGAGVRTDIEPKKYVLVLGENGEYYLIQK